MPHQDVSKQQAQPEFFLPLCFLQSTKGNLGGLSEDVLHVLSKLGRTFQVEGSSDLLAGTLALGGGGARIRKGAWSMGRLLRGLLRDLGAFWGWGPPRPHPRASSSPSVCAHETQGSVWCQPQAAAAGKSPSWPPPQALTLPNLGQSQGLTSAKN